MNPVSFYHGRGIMGGSNECLSFMYSQGEVWVQLYIASYMKNLAGN